MPFDDELEKISEKEKSHPQPPPIPPYDEPQLDQQPLDKPQLDQPPLDQQQSPLIRFFYGLTTSRHFYFRVFIIIFVILFLTGVIWSVLQ